MNGGSISELVTGPLEKKKGYRRQKARIEALPEPYRASAKAFQRYFLSYAGLVDGDSTLAMLEDFADLSTDEIVGWVERGEADQTRHAGILEGFGLTREEAEQLVLQARVAAGWPTSEAIATQPPPEAAARSRMPTMPRPGRWRVAPRPVSATSSSTASSP